MEQFAALTTEELLNHIAIPLLILAFFVGLGFWLNSYLTNLLRQKTAGGETTLKTVFLAALRSVPRTWCIVLGIYLVISYIDFSPDVNEFFANLIYILYVLTAVQVIARAVSGYISFKTSDDASASLLINIINFLVYGIGILIILDNFDISIAPMLTALGVGSMAVALALQDTLANIFAGLHLIILKQIKVGDYIRLNSGEEGRVSDISWRYTTLLQVIGNYVVVPNKTILGANIVNFSLPRDEMNISLTLGVSYDSDLDLVEKVTLEVAEEISKEINGEEIEAGITVTPRVFFNNFGDSSIDFTVYLYCVNISSKALMTHLFIKALTRRYPPEKINIPYPIRTIIKE